MKLDINAFRAIANQSPDKFVYVQGESLKTTRNKAHHAAHTYKAATDAFLAAYRQHYGAVLGDALKRHFEVEANGGTPLTARKIKALVAFADEKMGSAETIKAGDKEIELSKLGTDKMKRVGFRQATKMAKAGSGQKDTASATLAALKFGKDGKVDFKGMLRHLATFHSYIDREIDARGLSRIRPMAPIRDPGAPDAPLPEPPADMRSQAEIESAKLFEKGLFTAIDAMDNNELSAVYQGLISSGTDALKKEFARILNHPDVKAADRKMAKRAFTDLCRIEAMIVSEVSRRMLIDKAPENEKANVPSLMERYAGQGAPTANHFGGERDMTTANLTIMARNAAQGSNNSKNASEKTDTYLKAHGMGNVDSKKIGDMLRSQELTINMRFATLMGRREDGSHTTPMLQRQNAHVTNVFESKEQQGIEPDATGALKHRNQVEKSFFPEYADKPLAGKDRPVYGTLNAYKYTSGGADNSGGVYGRVVVVLKPHVKQRCTYSLDDTFFATRIGMPEAKRAEIEQALIAAFADRLADPEATLAALREAQEDHADALKLFFTKHGHATENISAQLLASPCKALAQFFEGRTKEGAARIDEDEIVAHFIEKYTLAHKTQAKVADYDHIENLIAQEADFTAVSMALSTLRQQENPKAPVALNGRNYIEAQFHGPILFDRDVEELRIDTDEMESYFEQEFMALPKEQQDAIRADATLGNSPAARKNAWVSARVEETKAQIKADTAAAPFKVTFYESSVTTEREFVAAHDEDEALELETSRVVKDDLVAAGNAFLGPRRPEIMDRIVRSLSGNITGPAVFARFGQDLSNIPDWLADIINERLHELIATFGTDPRVHSENNVATHFVQEIREQLIMCIKMMDVLEEGGITDPAERDRIVKDMMRLKPGDQACAEGLAMLQLVLRDALADVNAVARETFEKDIEGGAEMLRNAFAGNPPLSGVAKDAVAARIREAARGIAGEIAQRKKRFQGIDPKPETFAKWLRQDAVKPFLEKKAKIMQSQVFMKFPTIEERDAFLRWATSAGKLKNSAQFEGVYEGSTRLADALEAKIKSAAPLTAQDLVDCFKSFFPDIYDYMLEDASQLDEYGPDDRQCFVGRITSVALSRLALRVGQDGLAKLAAVLDSPDGRWFHNALIRGSEAEYTDATNRGGTAETAGAFMEILHLNLAKEYGFTIHRTSDTSRVDYSVVPPSARALFAQINPEQAANIEAQYPYNPSASGAKPLANAPAPANPAAMPQDNAGRKQFLLRMLPTYHQHEKTFDRGNNWHGRTHATRSFVFSIAMGNILKEKGVTIDMNAVALATAGHDTGRTKNGPDTLPSETRSADTVNAAVEQLYPGAAGDAWKNQIKANITTDTDHQNTIEGYLFKSADSLDYSRIDDLDEQYFPFLKENIVTNDGLVVAADNPLRRALMKEAKLLSDLTSPTSARHADLKQITANILQLGERPDAPENAVDALQTFRDQVVNDVRQQEIQQTETLSDEQIVELVENTIRSRPQDFPLLTKYYLNAA